MKITKITTYRLPPRWMFLKIETDEGVVGSKADGKSRDTPLCGKQRTEIQE